MMPLLSPLEIKQLYPAPASVHIARQHAIHAITGKVRKMVCLVGPCSIHDVDAALEYGDKLKNLAKKLPHVQLFMRVFFEKPRTFTGWTGLIYDPFLNGTKNIGKGIEIARKLLIDLSQMGIACVTELLEPLLTPYFEDLLSWGMIGARTAASQPHRQMASSLNFPIGFKNGLYGELDTAIYGILSARNSHVRLHIDEKGALCEERTKGNPWAHLVLRGGEKATNYAPSDIAHAIKLCQEHGIDPRIVIDCSHGNSQKNHSLQSKVFRSVLSQIQEGNSHILGMMLESNLYEGKQGLQNKNGMAYGVSITDACLGWTETEDLLLEAEEGSQLYQK